MMNVLIFLLLDKIPNIHNLTEEKFNLTYGFRQFSPWSGSSEAETSWLNGVVQQNCPVQAIWKQSRETVP